MDAIETLDARWIKDPKEHCKNLAFDEGKFEIDARALLA